MIIFIIIHLILISYMIYFFISILIVLIVLLLFLEFLLKKESFKNKELKVALLICGEMRFFDKTKKIRY